LQVEGDVRTNSAESKRPGNRTDGTGSSAKSFPRENNGLIDNRVVCEKRLPALVNQPGNVYCRQEILKGSRAGESMNNIAERTRLDEKERLSSQRETKLFEI
jgi:hypothetical protein